MSVCGQRTMLAYNSIHMTALIYLVVASIIFTVQRENELKGDVISLQLIILPSDLEPSVKWPLPLPVISTCEFVRKQISAVVFKLSCGETDTLSWKQYDFVPTPWVTFFYICYSRCRLDYKPQSVIALSLFEWRSKRQLASCRSTHGQPSLIVWCIPAMGS